MRRAALLTLAILPLLVPIGTAVKTAAAQLPAWNFRPPAAGTWIFYRPFSLVTAKKFRLRDPGGGKSVYPVWGPTKVDLPKAAAAGTPVPKALSAQIRALAARRGWSCQPRADVRTYDPRNSQRDITELAPLARRLSRHRAAGLTPKDRKCIAKLFNQAALALENRHQVLQRPFAEARPHIIEALAFYRAGLRFQVTNGLLANHAMTLNRLGHPRRALATFKNLPPIKLSFLSVFAGRMAIRLALLRAYVPAVVDRAGRRRHLTDAARYTALYDRAANGWQRRARLKAARQFWQRIFTHLLLLARTSGATKEAAAFQGALNALKRP